MVTARTASFNGKVEDVKHFAKTWYTVTFDTNDTFIAPDFVNTENLKFVAIISDLDGSELTNSVTNNVITCSGTASDLQCTVFVYGVKN
jgi:hypothetical protein